VRGGGAEILDEEYFGRHCPGKAGPGEWLGVHAAAHRLGLMTNATMLYGRGETAGQRMKHLLRLRELQDKSLEGGRGHFQCFVPLPFIPGEGEAEADGRGPSGLLDLQTIAISRLVLDNIEHIKAFWPMLGVNLAQVALAFGADDFDGTVRQYRIVTQGADNPTDSLSVESIRRLIREAGREPIERDAFYRPSGGEKKGVRENKINI